MCLQRATREKAQGSRDVLQAVANSLQHFLRVQWNLKDACPRVVKFYAPGMNRTLLVGGNPQNIVVALDRPFASHQRMSRLLILSE